MNSRPIILIVEDDEPSYLYLESIVKSLPANVLRAENGLKAVSFCTDNQDIGIVLMDLKMPVMDGLEATRKIRSMRQDLPIIAVTAYAFSSDEKKVLAAGCDEYLSKPVKKELLLKKLEKYGFVITG